MATQPTPRQPTAHLHEHQGRETPTPDPPPRQIIQIAAISLGNGTVLALCNDGTLWEASPLTALWRQIDVDAITKSAPQAFPFPATAGGAGAAVRTM